MESEPQYVGGDPFPADLWGRAPLRGKAAVCLEEWISRKVESGHDFSAGEIVDALIRADLFPDECDNREPPVGWEVQDEAGHVWGHREDGWHCVTCADEVLWTWEEVKEDAEGNLVVRGLR